MNVYGYTVNFILSIAKSNNLNYKHIDNKVIYNTFGDYANIVIFNSKNRPIELKTNETIEKGKHF